MTIHFHFLQVPVTITLGKKNRREREFTEAMNALCLYSLLPRTGQLARYTLRKWAKP